MGSGKIVSFVTEGVQVERELGHLLRPRLQGYTAVVEGVEEAVVLQLVAFLFVAILPQEQLLE